jgi:hypothetical protein
MAVEPWAIASLMACRVLEGFSIAPP